MRVSFGLQETISLTVSLAAIVWLLFNIDLSGLESSFSRLNPAWLPLMAVTYLLVFPIRGLRWRAILRPVKSVTLSTTTSITLIARMSNNLLPARLGELIRAFVIAEQDGITRATAFTSVGVERCFDGIALFVIFVVSARMGILESAHKSLISRISGVTSLLLLFIVLLIAVSRAWPDKIMSLVGYLVRFMPGKMKGFLTFIEKALEIVNLSFRLDRRLVVFLLLSFAAWLTEALMFMFAMAAFNLPADPLIACFTLALVNMGIAVPSAPGDIGVFHASTVLAFTSFNISNDLALSYSVVVHAVEFVSATTLGLLLLPRYGLSLRTLRSSKEEKESRSNN